MMKLHLILATMLVMVCMSLAAVGQDEIEDDLLGEDDLIEFKYKPNPNRIRLKSVITEDLAAKMKAGQPITVRIPAGQSQIISSIVMKKPAYFKQKLLSIRPRTRVVGGNVIVPVPVQLIDRLDYQPIELIVYQSGVSQATLVPADDPENTAGLATKYINPDYFVRLRPDNGVAITSRSFDNFDIKNDLFEVKLPFSEIEAINFDEQDTSQATIILKNGDCISGEHSWPQQVEFETPWGEEKIDLGDIVSLTRNKSVHLVPSGSDYPKLILIDNKQFTTQK